MGRRILITGAAGFVGFHLSKTLAGVVTLGQDGEVLELTEKPSSKHLVNSIVA